LIRINKHIHIKRCNFYADCISADLSECEQMTTFFLSPVTSDTLITGSNASVLGAFSDAVNLATLPDGNFVAVWDNHPASGIDEVWGCILSADGQPVGSAFAVSTLRTTPGGAGLDQWDPTATYLQDGSFIVAWTTEEYNGGYNTGRNVMMRHFAVDGTPLGDPFVAVYQVSPTGYVSTSSWESTPSLTTLADGSVVLSYTNDLDIDIRIYEADGVTPRTTLQINTLTDTYQGYSHVTALTGGGFVVTWEDSNGVDGSSSSVIVQQFNADGTIAAPQHVVNTATYGGQEEPVVEALADGGYVIGWYDGYDETNSTFHGTLRAQIFNADGTHQGAELRLPDVFDRYYRNGFEIVGLPDGGFFVAFTTSMDWSGNSYDIFGQRFNSDGTPIGAAFRMTDAITGGQQYPRIELGENGLITLIWQDNGSGDTPAGMYSRSFSITQINGPATWSDDIIQMDDSGQALDLLGGNDSAFGGAGDDTLLGNYGHDLLSGNDGNDQLDGGYGNDSLLGDAGNDTLLGGIGNDTLRGGEGNDMLSGQADNDLLAGDAGNDTILTGAGNDTASGGDGDDLISDYTGDDLLSGDAGNDTIWGGEGNDTLYGGADNDRLYGQNGNDQVWGGTGDDTLNGGEGNDALGGAAGDDLLYGENGNDALYGDIGNDTLNGGAGDDTLWAGDDDDILYGISGANILGGGAGNDTIWGGSGNDLVYGYTGVDQINGGEGNDTLWAGAGDDFIEGSGGNDVLYGADGWDALSGGWGNDTLDGGADADNLVGDQGNDLLLGGAGDDWLLGGSGTDTMTGGDGADFFVFQPGEDTGIVTDFDIAEGDQIEMVSALWTDHGYGTMTAAQVIAQFATVNAWGSTVFTFDGGELLILQGVTDLTTLEGALFVV
jgi:Ca2+-binding RTX toxin-like protein